MALASVYRAKCKQLRQKPNARVASALPSDAAGLTGLDLSDNVIGGAGLDALVDVIGAAPNLTSLSLRGNNLTAPSVQRMTRALKSAGALRRLDLSSNDIRLAGPELLDLVKTNRRIESVELSDTQLRPLFANLIALQLRKNARRTSGARAPAPAVPPVAAPAHAGPRSSGGCLKQKVDTSGAVSPRKQVGFGEAAVCVTPSQPPPPAPVPAAPAPAVDLSGGQDGVSHEQLRRFSAFEEADADTRDTTEAEFGKFTEPLGSDRAPTPEQQSMNERLGSFSFGSPSSPDGSASKTGGRPALGQAPVLSFRAGPADIIAPTTASASTDAAQGVPRNHLQLKKVANRRPTVCAEVFTGEQLDRFVPDVHEKTKEEQDFLLMALERHHLFNHLDDRELMVAVDAMSECLRVRGDYVYEQGDDELDTAYIVYQGEVSLAVDGEITKTLRKSDSFGELFLLYPNDALESAKTERDSTLFMLDRMTYKFILSQASKKKRALYGGFLKKVPFLQSLSDAELLQLADALKGSVYDSGTPLIRYGEEGTWLHIVLEGTVEVIGRDDKQQPIKVCEFTVGDCVGELEFINNHQTVADVVAGTKVRTAKMNRRHFEMCMGPVIDLLRKNADKLEVYSYYRETLARIKDGNTSPVKAG